MTPEQYRNHPSGALRRAFFRGGYAAEAGQQLTDNPYRKVLTTRTARRGSWSEAFSAAWAVGWHLVMDRKAPAALAATSEPRGESN